jgi:hypothetical protein
LKKEQKNLFDLDRCICVCVCVRFYSFLFSCIYLVNVTLSRFFFPINLNDAHWVAGLVDIKAKKIYIFDSMSGNSHSRLREQLLQVG